MKNRLRLNFHPSGVSYDRKHLLILLVMFSGLLLITACQKEYDQQFTEEPTGETLSANQAVFRISGNTYYVSPSGDDNNAGTLSSPFKTLDKLSSVLTPGDIAYLRGGTYRITKSTSQVNRSYISNLNGTLSDSIYIVNYPGEKPVFNMDDQLILGSPGDGPVGLKIENCRYLYLKGIRITGLKQNPANINTPAGMILFNVDNSTIEMTEVDNIEGYGIYFQGGSDDNLLKNVDVHHIGDKYSGWGGANGFNITGGDPSTRNTFDGCRAWWCSDDGFDLYGTNAVVTFKNCWAFWNGYQPGTFTQAGDGQGFKLGPTATDQSGSSVIYRTVTGCFAFENRVNGFDQNAQTNTTCLMAFYNNTAFGNRSNGYFFGANTSVSQIFKNNLNYNNGIWGSEIQSGTNVSHNSWNGVVSVSNADFISISSAGADGARQEDGSLPNLSFLKLATGSDLINAGINVGLPFIGTAPDLGSFESGSTTIIPPANQAPVANAGIDRNIILPVNNISLTGSDTDADGTITTYAWALQSGPSSPVLSGATSSTLSASNLVAGTYVFRLTVTDNGGLTALDEVSVVVSGTVTTTGANSINITQAVSAGGYGYYVIQDFGTLPDNAANPSRSVLRIFENGVELQPPHSIHNEILTLGGGRFSHWSDGSTVMLYFSASDNSNPKTNGRTYTYSVSAGPSSPTGTNTPYGGTARLIPGIIQAEDYDNGGQNIAYYDRTTGNAGNRYRTAESADIGLASKESSHYLGWTQANEWLKYTVNITTTKNYTLQLRVASASSGKSVRIEIDGAIIASVSIPNTGGSQKWVTISLPGIYLSAGTKVMRIYNVTGGQNINYISFQ